MKEDPTKGDWIELLKDDLKEIEMSLEDEESIKVMSTKDFKNMVKDKVRLAAYKDLEIKKSSHEKVKDIVHFNLNHPKNIEWKAD